MDHFVSHHVRKMKGNLYFFNIPLKTFIDDESFRKIWKKAIGRNHHITKIHMLLDESLRNQWSEIVASHWDYFSKYGSRFVVKFKNIRRCETNETKPQPYESLNFGVWSEPDIIEGKSRTDLVTMTGVDYPWGNENEPSHFLAVTERKDLCREIRSFVKGQYDSAPDSGKWVSDILIGEISSNENDKRKRRSYPWNWWART